MENFETFDVKRMALKTNVETIETIICNNKMKDNVRENGEQTPDGIFLIIYEGELGKQGLLLDSEDKLYLCSENRQEVNRQVVETKAKSILSENEPLGNMGGYLVHIPQAIEVTKENEPYLVELSNNADTNEK